ncbi:uncharacterized protein ATNIH1004_011813 [Aspergillus tanneri]|uniref:Uncharacterized protein n=1 Tax=Aspergillus tanneri TaxID=1220188 RepID=A0A5M9MFC4_9EURO|nr:uncharacterized protein ATNIH1004_011813 [Aspergillus tanneri]KAA8641677.1 hypothetical protein ATNIH1004_011813 [Aspergillus tanneri]
MPNHSLTADEAVTRLVKFSNLTHHRTYLKDSEQKRVDEALQLLTNGRPPVNAKGAKQKITYLETQRNIRKKFGDTGVVLCAAGLGPSIIANMRDEERVYLPSKLSEKWNELEIDVFENLASGVNKDTSLTSVHGDVYELSMEDLQKIAAMPGQITGIS